MALWIMMRACAHLHAREDTNETSHRRCRERPRESWAAGYARYLLWHFYVLHAAWCAEALPLEANCLFWASARGSRCRLHLTSQAKTSDQRRSKKESRRPLASSCESRRDEERAHEAVASGARAAEAAARFLPRRAVAEAGAWPSSDHESSAALSGSAVTRTVTGGCTNRRVARCRDPSGWPMALAAFSCAAPLILPTLYTR